MPSRRIKSSRFLESPPPIDWSSAVVLTPSSYASWSAMLSATASVNDVLLTPGDYVAAWGTTMQIQTSGTQARRKTIRYYDPATDYLHPLWRRSPATEARVGIITFGGGSSRPHDWYFYGLTALDLDGEWSTGSGSQGGKATYVTWDWCLGDEAQGYGVRVHSSNVTVQRSVFRQSIEFGQNDAPALQIFGTLGEPITGIKFLNNELVNWFDGMALSDDATDGMTPYNDVLIEQNDTYITEARYLAGGTLAQTENGIDIKAGSNIPRGVTLRNNRWWGFRQTQTADPNEAGSMGQAIAIHRFGRHVYIAGDIIGDCPGGITEFAWHTGSGIPQTTPRYNEIERVSFHDISNYAGAEGVAGAGACTRANGNTDYHHCTFARSDYVAYAHTDYRPSEPIFTSNVRVETEVFHPDSNDDNPYAETDATRNVHRTRDVVYGTYERKQWSGPEFAEGAEEVSTATYAQIRDEQARLIEAITPTTAADVKFRRDEGRVEFSKWVEQNPTASFRRFSILGSMRDEGPLVTNCDTETYRTDTIVVVAYPKQFGKYGGDNIRDLQDLVDEDKFLLDNAIGHLAIDNLLNAQSFCRRVGEPATSEAGSSWLVTYVFETEYQRAV